MNTKKFLLPKGKRENYFIISFGVILAVIVTTISIISLQQITEPTKNDSLPLPTPISTVNVIPDNSQLQYNEQASKKFLFRENNRTPLVSSDAQAKERILKLLPSGQNYGVVYSSSNIIIDYTQALDVFNGEIITVNVADAKKEAELWFKEQGMSQQGICNLPLGFYPSWDIANILKQSNFVFNELPDGC